VKKKQMKRLNYAHNNLYGERRSKRCIKYFVCSLLQLCVRIQCEDLVSRQADIQQSENVPSGYYVHNVDNSRNVIPRLNSLHRFRDLKEI